MGEKGKKRRVEGNVCKSKVKCASDSHSGTDLKIKQINNKQQTAKRQHKQQPVQRERDRIRTERDSAINNKISKQKSHHSFFLSFTSKLERGRHDSPAANHNIDRET